MSKMFDLLNPLTKYLVNRAMQDNLIANAEELSKVSKMFKDNKREDGLAVTSSQS